MTKFLANGLANNAHNVYSNKNNAALIRCWKCQSAFWKPIFIMIFATRRVGA